MNHLHHVARPFFFVLLVALFPTGAAAGGPGIVPPSPTSSCNHRTPYQVSLISGAGPFTPANDPFVKHPAIPKLSYNYLNTGATIPHLVLQVMTRNTFTPGGVSAVVNTGTRRYFSSVTLLLHAGQEYIWDFGTLPAGAEVLVRVQMHLQRRCCYAAFVQTYANRTPFGQPDPATLVVGGISGGSGSSGPG